MKVFVHRYKDSHSKRRKVLRRKLKEGKVTLILKNKDGWLYEIPEKLN